MTRSNPVAIEAIDLMKDYGRGENAVHALRGVNISFEQGRFTAIMGPSGSGKSTLMHTLAGLDSASGGKIIFDGADLTAMNDSQLTLLRRHRIGFIFQSFNLLPMFSAEQNILMPLTLAGEKPDRSWFKVLVETLGLERRLSHRPNELSGGQQQRVAIARALISKPAVVFADEPTGNLDSVSSAEVLSFLKQSVKELGQTVIMVTHDAVAASYADRAIVFADGRIVADETDPAAERMSELLMEERDRVTRSSAAPTVAQRMSDSLADTKDFPCGQ
jgi:putative ABC transport system ATP-binding protein